jgi:hypothetical protein
MSAQLCIRTQHLAVRRFSQALAGGVISTIPPAAHRHLFDTRVFLLSPAATMHTTQAAPGGNASIPTQDAVNHATPCLRNHA